MRGEIPTLILAACEMAVPAIFFRAGHHETQAAKIFRPAYGGRQKSPIMLAAFTQPAR